MSAPDPIAIAENGMFAHLRPSPAPGEPPQVLSTWEEEHLWFRTFHGHKWRLPPAATMTTVCNLNRNSVAGNQWSVSARDAHGVDLNNLAALHICDNRLHDAWEALAEAEEQFIAISGFFPEPPPPALLDRAVVLHNASIVDEGMGRFAMAEDRRAMAREMIEAVPAHKQDSGYGLVASALRETSN